MRCAGLFDGFELSVGLDAVDDHCRRNAGSEPHQVMEEPLAPALAAADEECVQLHDVDGNGQQRFRRRVTRSETVQGDSVAQIARAFNELRRHRQGGQRQALRYLENQARGHFPISRKQIVEFRPSVLVENVPGRDIATQHA